MKNRCKGQACAWSYLMFLNREKSFQCFKNRNYWKHLCYVSKNKSQNEAMNLIFYPEELPFGNCAAVSSYPQSTGWKLQMAATLCGMRFAAGLTLVWFSLYSLSWSFITIQQVAFNMPLQPDILTCAHYFNAVSFCSFFSDIQCLSYKFDILGYPSVSQSSLSQG